MHALVQVIRNLFHKHIPVSEEERRKLIHFKDALVNVAQLDVPYKRVVVLFKTYLPLFVVAWVSYVMKATALSKVSSFVIYL